MSKSTVRSMNSSKNKLNSEIILIFNPNPNAHLYCFLALYFNILFIGNQNTLPNTQKDPLQRHINIYIYILETNTHIRERKGGSNRIFLKNNYKTQTILLVRQYFKHILFLTIRVQWTRFSGYKSSILYLSFLFCQ